MPSPPATTGSGGGSGVASSGSGGAPGGAATGGAAVIGTGGGPGSGGSGTGGQAAGGAGGANGASVGVVDGGVDSAPGDDAGAGAGTGGRNGNGGGAVAGASGGAGRSGGSGAGGGGGGNGGGATGGASGPFTCNLLVGPSTMGQWFNGGFLTYPGIDATRWELIMVAHHYTNVWAMPGYSAWKTPVSHPCASGSATPDRVLFMATQWTENTAAEWEADFAGIIKNILTLWPMVKRIELMPTTSAPGNQACPGQNATSSETVIPAAGYVALDAMPAKYPGLVFSTPHFEVPKCSDFIGNGSAPQYAPDANATTGPAVMDVANVFGAYYSLHP